MNTNNIIDIDLSITNKQTFRINGDNDRILELNTSDMGIISRIKKSTTKLNKLAQKAANIKFDDFVKESSTDNLDELSISEPSTDVVADKLKEIDTDMRHIIDEIFDTNASDICAPYGTMFDPFNGKYRFQYVIDTLINLCTDKLQNEYGKMLAESNKHTDKYTRG